MSNRLARLRRRRPPVVAGPDAPPTALDDGYAGRVEAEREIYAEREVIHDLPPIFHYWSSTHLLPMLNAVGIASVEDLFAGAFERSYRERGHARTARFASIGAGNCDTEVRLAQDLFGRGCEDFVIECLELNPAMLERGAAHAREAGVERHIRTVVADFNAWEPDGGYDGILVNQALHHVVDLEGVYDRIKGALAPQGRFVTSDMIGRNGHLRWPEARRIVDEFWQELPSEHRFHRLLRRQEDTFLDWDCSREGFEGIRAQDVLPLLVERFSFETFLGFGNVIDVFVDRGFGPNFDPNGAWDRDFIDRVHQRDLDGLRSGELTPTHLMAVMRTSPTPDAPRLWESLTPEACVRRADRDAVRKDGVMTVPPFLRRVRGALEPRVRRALRARTARLRQAPDAPPPQETVKAPTPQAAPTPQEAPAPREDPVHHCWDLGHFYSPIPDTRVLAREPVRSRVWPEQARELPGVDWRAEEQVALVRDRLGRQQPLDFAREPTGDPTEYHTKNDLFSRVDAWALQAMLRELRPERVIEVGCGWSSLVTARVGRECLDGRPHFTCIEPYPPDFLGDGVDGISELIASPVQDVPLERFAALEAGDVLFIDSAHVIKTGGDVQYLYHEVIPRLRPGVAIHVHDIFLPRDYREEWVLVGRGWNEQYLLQSFLAFNDSFEVLLGMAWMCEEHPDLLAAQIPDFDPALDGAGSFWMRRIATH